MKKRLIVVVMSILLTSSNVVFADNGVVNTKSSALSVRQKSSLSSSVIGYIAKNTKVTTLGKVAGFYKINYTGKLGYVSSNYIKIVAPVVVKPLVVKPLVNKTQYGQVTASKLSIRTGPGVKYTEVGIFTAGTKVIMYDKVNNFYKLTYKNKTGYISAAYIKIIAKPVVAVTPKTVYKNQYGVVTANGISIRTGAGVQYSWQGSFPIETKLNILGTAGSFYKVSYSGKTGYVSNEYVKITAKPVAAKPAPVVVKPSVNKTQYGQVTASSLSIRTGPGVNYTEMGIFIAGTKVIMYDKVNNFYKLTYENKTGYVSAAYVKITAKPVVVVLTNASKTETIISNYNYSLDTITDIQYGLKMALTDSAGKWLLANKAQIKYYVDPINAQSAENKYQFLKLDYAGGISASDIDTVLSGKGVLNKKGEVVLDSCKSSNVNPAYLISHAFLESGYGESDLANGIIVTQVKGAVVQPRVVYNLFGIGAVDAAPEKLGSEYAYSNNWFSVDQAIEGGANWISKYYINNATNKQNTLYKMRWNPYTTGMHQYATDIGWASKQTKSIKAIMDKFTNVDLYFDVPKYM